MFYILAEMVRAFVRGAGSLRKWLRLRLLALRTRAVLASGTGLVHSRGQTSKMKCHNELKAPLQGFLHTESTGTGIGSGRHTPGAAARFGGGPTKHAMAMFCGCCSGLASALVNDTAARRIDRLASTRWSDKERVESSVIRCRATRYGAAPKSARQNGNRTPNVNETSSLTASLTATCISASRCRSGVGLNSMPARTGKDVSLPLPSPVS